MYTERAPPPVPPKDMPSGSDAERPPTSRSKRKRSVDEHAASYPDDAVAPSEDEGHTPKRSRSTVDSSACGDASDDNVPRSVRRKKGSRNLSNLNLRHAAKMQSKQALARGSRFQEGSLTDRPSGTPPSMFTRFPRHAGEDLERIDDLMATYHDTASGSEQEQGYSEDEDMLEEGSATSEQEPKSFFRFPKSLSKIYMFGLWNRIYDETHEKLLEQNRLEAERKARLKLEAEAKYAEMKQAGQLDPVLLTNLRASLNTPTPRDSVLGPESNRSSFNHKRTISVGSELATPEEYAANQEMIGVPVTEPKTLRTSKSRFNLRRPSFSNLKNGLKRVASDLNIAAFGAREATSSVSPEKIDDRQTESDTLHPRFEGKSKDTLRLSRRVSDLERKLRIAREELGNALQEASPAPGSTGKFQRFTPSTLRKARFVPGNLPTLPSERLLFAQEPQIVTDQAAEVNTDDGYELYADEEDNQETIRASRAQVIRPRVSSLFKPFASQNNVALQTYASQRDIPAVTTLPRNSAHALHEVTAMDPNSFADSLDANLVARPADATSLTERLQSIDDAAKLAKKEKRSKKRKSSLEKIDPTFKPSAEEEDDDDAQWAAASHTPKKKLKHSNKSETNLRGKANANKLRSPVSKNTHTDLMATIPQSVPQEQPVLSISTSELSIDSYHPGTLLTQGVGHNMAMDEPVSPVSEASFTHSLEPGSPVSVAHSLEPVYEEEEETTTVPLKDEPSRPTAKATPARYNVHALRTRSTSPDSRAAQVKSGITSVLQAGSAAKHRRGTRTVSPLPMGGSTIDEVLEETFTAVPGRNGVPDMPKGVISGVVGTAVAGKQSTGVQPTSSVRPGHRSGGSGEEFEWPEDVF